ncbi:MAG: FAD-dependent oxidoreductase [Candidatus Latescibacterota bacterium]
MSEKVRYINAAEWETESILPGKTVLDFYSTECPPCEALAPKFDALSTVYGDEVRFYKIFRQENRALAERLEVKSSPTVLFFEDGREVGKRLTGGIRRADLMSNLEAMVGPERSAELRTRLTPRETECDVLIVGGGPAGLTAGIYLAQAKAQVILVDAALPGGQVSATHTVSNYPGFSEPLPGWMLMHHMGEQAKAAGVEFRAAVDVTSLDLELKTVVVDGLETIRAKNIILATGSSPRPLGVTGEREYTGRGVSYCATCDAKYYQDRDVIVIGGGNSAVEESLFIARFARSITIIHQFDVLQANRTAQERAFAEPKIRFLFEHEPREFRKNGNGMDVDVESLRTGERKTVSGDGVFVFAGMRPNLDIFESRKNEVEAGLALDEWGYVRTDERMRTNIPGVFAAGDIRSKPFRQITTAVSDGTIAGIAAAKELDN